MKVNDLIGMRVYRDYDLIGSYGIVRETAMTYLHELAHVNVLWLTGPFKGDTKSHIPSDLIVVGEY